MKKQIIISIVFLLVLTSGIGVVSAESVSGTLSSGGGWLSNNYATSNWTANNPQAPKYNIVNVELTANTTSIVHFDTTGKPATFDAGAPHGAQTPFNFTIGTHILGTGQFGYQRLFDGAWPTPNEIQGYQYWQMDTWNITGQSGTVNITMNYNRNNVYNFTPQGRTDAPGSLIGDVPPGYFYISDVSFATQYQSGSYTYNRDNPFSNTYDATKPSGIGITGNVTKGGYASRAYIVDGVSSVPITSQALVTTTDFPFNIPAETIKICVINSNGDWYNSSQLFTVTAPTVTPTITPTPVPTIPPGYVRTEIATYDVYGAIIQGTNIQIKDVEAGVWKNSTDDADGILWIDTLPYHTLNAYGQFTTIANQYQDASALGLSTGYDGGIRFWLILYPYNPDVGAGNTNLFVTVTDNNGPLANALVKIGIPNNATLLAYTPSSGVQSFVVPNQTVLHITAEKSGYQTMGTTINSGTGTTAFANIRLDRLVVTIAPTSTIPPGGITPAVTVDIRTNPQKAEGALNILYANGESIVMVCVLMTVLGLLGIKLGK